MFDSDNVYGLNVGFIFLILVVFLATLAMTGYGLYKDYSELRSLDIFNCVVAVLSLFGGSYVLYRNISCYREFKDDKIRGLRSGFSGRGGGGDISDYGFNNFNSFRKGEYTSFAPAGDYSYEYQPLGHDEDQEFRKRELRNTLPASTFMPTHKSAA